MNQRDAILEVLSDGEPCTMDALITEVHNRTASKSTKKESLQVHISNLRKDGYKIVSERVDKVTTYRLKGSKGRKRASAKTQERKPVRTTFTT